MQDADLKYNGQDYQGISTEDIYNKEGTETTYEDVEIMLVADVSGSMNGSIDNIKNLANKVQEGIASKLPKIKIGLTKFSNEAELILRPTNNTNKLKREIEKLNSNGETAMQFFEEYLLPDALYLLDEPEVSLSPANQVLLAKELNKLARLLSCQFIIATHSPFMLGTLDAKIYNIDKEDYSICEWYELENVRYFYNFFKKHEKEFEG